ncbi:MAG: hypothetical protein WCV70_03540 [Patescibacteria group bacterium]|jgi:hypothetical protein
MIYYIVYIIAIYILLVFVLSRLVIPHLGFSEEKIPEQMPAEMRVKIEEYKAQSRTDEEFLRLAYDYLGSRYRSERFNTFLKFNYLFKSLDEAWRMGGYLPCTVNNYLLKIFLVSSGWFKEEDIRRRHVFVNFILHQYLQVKINDKWLDVDVGEKQRGLPIGKHLKYFG